jgi:hypothetical protein
MLLLVVMGTLSNKGKTNKGGHYLGSRPLG